MSNQSRSGSTFMRHDLAESDERYRIFVRDLVLMCRIGAYPEERLKTQRVRFNLDILVQAPADPIGDDLAQVLSYDTVIADIRELTSRGHINLVETLAAEIADICLADPRVAEVKVTVEKLDVEPAAAGVGVEIERRRRRSYPSVAELFPRRSSGH
jgi:dihydroneopterin aldolase